MAHKHSRLDQARILRILSGQDRDLAARTLRAATNLGVPPYRAVTAARNTLFTCRLLPAHKLGRPTISVGNLTVGGTGKTPMVIELAERLQAMGHKPAVLMRGYEPTGLESRQGSDEAAVLRGTFGPSVPVHPDPSRIRGARAVLAEHPQISVFLLDDGFQHRKAHRDLDIVLLDASRPFGFGRLLPRGLLREPPSALRRADAVIITRADRVEPDELAGLDATVRRLTGRPPLAHCAHRWSALRQGHKTHPIQALASLKVLGTSGLGNPADFEATLRATAGGVARCLAFDDHHPYTRSEVQGIMHTAREYGAQAVVTTEKDWVKWRKFAGGVKLPLPVYRPVVQMRFLDGEAQLDKLLEEAASC